MVRGPGAADGYLAVFELLGGCGVAVLVFFYGFGIDEVRDVDEHALRSDFLAAHFFFQGIEELVNLD
jgi:hypothetical protein